MFEDFFIRALIAGIGVSIVTGPLGCFIIWRRMAYFGDTLAHAALLGVVLALLLEINHTLAVFLVSAAISLLLFVLQSRFVLSSDSLLGLLSHTSLAIGLVSLAFMSWVRVDLFGLLFGDILSVSNSDIFIIFGCGIIVLVVLAFFWRNMFAATVNSELAAAEGLKPDRANLVLVLLIALVIAISMKIIGVLLLTSMLIIPAVSARRFINGPGQMAIVSIIVGILSVCCGLYGSLQWNTPSGPSIVVAAFVFFLLSLTPLSGQIRRIFGSNVRVK